ncbi:MAG: toprim domain-containing protein [Pirellulaceae bacterium]
MNIQQAKQIRLESLLAKLGCEPDRRAGDELWYRSPFRDEQTASFKLHPTRNIWYDHGLGKGGAVIEFAQVLFRTSDVAAVLAKLGELVDGTSILRPTLPLAEEKEFPPAAKIEITDRKPIQHPALVEYLSNRGIEAAAADKAGLIEIHYERDGKNYFALALPNDTGLEGGEGLEIRSKYFKGTFGRKDIRTIPGSSQYVLVFEGMFDYLTHQSTHSDSDEAATVIILNSAAMKDKAIDKIRSLGATHVDLYLDNDATGKSLAEYFKTHLAASVVTDKSGLYAGAKDLNDYHVMQKSTLGRLSERLKGEKRPRLAGDGPSF